MKDAAEPASPSATTLNAALLDYYEAPGKYQLTLRQPALLFSSIRDILQLASGRGAAEGPDGGRLGEAAQFFLRAALLYPGADHYAVMGAAEGEVPADLKERYRLLMRLIHPDFAHAGGTTWPADAAMRVNRAYEILSSPVLRGEYDDQMASLRSQRPPAPAKPPAFHAAARRGEERTPRVGKRAALVFGLAVGIPAVLLLMPRSEPVQLVQRAAPAASAQRLAAVQADATAPSALASTPQIPLAEPTLPVQGQLPAASTPPASAMAVASAAPAPSPAPVAHAASTPAAPVVVARAAMPEAPLQARAVVAAPPAPIARAASPVPPPPVAAATPAPVPRAPEPQRAAASASKEPVAPAPIADVEPLPAPVPTPAPAAATTVATVNTPAPIATAAPSAVPAGKLTTTLALATVPAPTLADAQPLLTQVLQMLETGSGEQLLRLLDTDARSKPGTQALLRQYEQMVKSGRPIVLTQVEFNSEPRDGGVLLVTGRMRLHVGEPTIGSFGQKLQLKAEFAQRGGKVQLTGLSGSPE
jgi:hypothetical protein